jgi:hypothetical protein
VKRDTVDTGRATTCDEVRELLPEHLLGTLPEPDDAAVRRHLRGCGGCRNEMAMLGEGLATFSRAAHQADPPPELRARVLAAVADERAEVPAPTLAHDARRHRAMRWLAAAAAVVVLAGTLAWAVTSSVDASHARARAAAYERFLDALGGKEVRVASLHGAGGRQVDGSAILYDSDVGQSWVLVLVRSPGATGKVKVVLRSPTDRIDMHETEFSPEGSTDAWLVTHNDISRYNRVAVYDGKGNLLATGRVVES